MEVSFCTLYGGHYSLSFPPGTKFRDVLTILATDTPIQNPEALYYKGRLLSPTDDIAGVGYVSGSHIIVHSSNRAVVAAVLTMTDSNSDEEEEEEEEEVEEEDELDQSGKEEHVNALVQLGFSVNDAEEALFNAEHNIDLAAEMLLNAADWAPGPMRTVSDQPPAAQQQDVKDIQRMTGVDIGMVLQVYDECGRRKQEAIACLGNSEPKG
jgi:hypothetical protein